MASLYEIEQSILDCIDTETGEIIDAEKLNELMIEKEVKIENVALWVKNLLSDADAFKAEKDAFAEREKAARNKAENLKQWLSMTLDGQKFSTSKVQISFRNSESVEIEDEKKFVDWAWDNERDDLLTYKDPTPNKTAIKQLLKSGKTLNGVSIVKNQNIQIK
jgi:hypothetical protein|nr:MAG TPA: resistance protein [Caudoviricetes sp.]